VVVVLFQVGTPWVRWISTQTTLAISGLGLRPRSSSIGIRYKFQFLRFTVTVPRSGWAIPFSFGPTATLPSFSILFSFSCSSPALRFYFSFVSVPCVYCLSPISERLTLELPHADVFTSRARIFFQQQRSAAIHISIWTQPGMVRRHTG